jgi:hypothetical protein
VRISTIVTILAVIALAVFVFPKLTMIDRAPWRYAPETAALKAIQTVNTAQVRYKSQFGRFATSLIELGPPTSGTANATSADLISKDLGSGGTQDYRFTLTGTPAGYTITALPKASGSTGPRTFFSDQSLVVRENDGPEPATLKSREVGSAAQREK